MLAPTPGAVREGPAADETFALMRPSWPLAVTPVISSR